MRVAGFLVVGTLPAVVRDKYGMRWGRGERVAFEALARSSRLGRPLVPRRLRTGSSADAYALVQRTERDRVRAGRSAFETVG